MWPLNTPLEDDEKILVELRTQTTKILLKTGLGATKSGSSGTISSSSKCLGKYVIFTQGEFFVFNFVVYLLETFDILDKVFCCHALLSISIGVWFGFICNLKKKENGKGNHNGKLADAFKSCKFLFFLKLFILGSFVFCFPLAREIRRILHGYNSWKLKKYYWHIPVNDILILIN